MSSAAMLLRDFVIRTKMPRKSINDLLHIVKKFDEDSIAKLPKDSRKFLSKPKTSLKFQVQDMPPGEYVYFGIDFNLKRQDIQNELSEESEIKMTVNIDGKPLYSTSRIEFWPILGRVKCKVVQKLNMNSQQWRIEDIKHKMYLLPRKQSTFVAIKLQH